MIKPYHETEHGVLYHGDCLEIMPMLADKSVDLVLTDPPYGLGSKLHDGGTWSTNPIYDSMLDWDKIISQNDIDYILSFAKNSIVWGGNYYQFKPSRCWLIWSKTNSVQTMADAELAWTSFDLNIKTHFMHVNPDGKREHPTQKPLSLFTWCLNNYSKPNQLILDPFAGSGTTAIACINTKRRYILIEMEEKYCEIAAKRIETTLDQQEIEL